MLLKIFSRPSAKSVRLCLFSNTELSSELPTFALATQEKTSQPFIVTW
jgi:hypothetical protein